MRASSRHRRAMMVALWHNMNPALDPGNSCDFLGCPGALIGLLVARQAMISDAAPPQLQEEVVGLSKSQTTVRVRTHHLASTPSSGCRSWRGAQPAEEECHAADPAPAYCLKGIRMEC